MLNKSESDLNTEKQIQLLTKAEELMTEARKVFQEISKESKQKDYTSEITLILSNCERASQIVDNISLKEVIPERLHMTQSTKNSITSQTVFYRKWISDYMILDSNNFDKKETISEKSEIESFKLIMAKLSYAERNLVSSFEKQKKSNHFSEVLEIYRIILFRIIDFFEGYIANQHEEESKSKFQKGK